MPEQQRCDLIWKMKVYAFVLSNPYITIYYVSNISYICYIIFDIQTYIIFDIQIR